MPGYAAWHMVNKLAGALARDAEQRNRQGPGPALPVMCSAVLAADMLERFRWVLASSAARMPFESLRALSLVETWLGREVMVSQSNGAAAVALYPPDALALCEALLLSVTFEAP